MNSDSDEQLLHRIQAGERAAFGRLYERYKRALYGYCLRLLSNESWAEDAVHDTFLKVYSSAHSVNSPESFRMWLYRIARNEVLMILRQKKKMSEADVDELPDDETPFEVVSRDEAHKRVGQLLDQLSIVYREVIVLREIEQLSYAEIAELTGTTLSSVKSRIFKARKALAARVAPRRKNERSDA